MKRAICLVGVLGTGLVAGCGSGDDSTPKAATAPLNSTPKATTAPLIKTPSKISKADFIKKADHYCAQLTMLLRPSSPSSSELLNDLHDVFQGLLYRLVALGTPGDRAGLAEFFDAGNKLDEAFDQSSDSRGGSAAVLARAKAAVASAESLFSKAARAYGFKKCGQGLPARAYAATAASSQAP